MWFFFFCLVKWQTREINASRQAVILSTTPARSWLRILWMTMELDENEKKYVQPSFLWFSLKTEMNFWEFLLGFAWFLFYMWKSMNIIPGNSKNCKMSILIFISVAYARQFLGRNQYYPAHGMLFPLMQGAKWGKKECVVQSKSHYNQCKVHLQISLRWDKVLCRWAGFAGCSSLQWWIKAVTKFLEQIKIQMILFPKVSCWAHCSWRERTTALRYASGRVWGWEWGLWLLQRRGSVQRMFIFSAGIPLVPGTSG